MSRSSTFGPSVFLGEGVAASGGAPRRAPGVAAVLLWLAAGLCLGYWLMQALGRTPLTPVAAPALAIPSPDAAGLARVLGAAAPASAAAGPNTPAPLSSRFQLLGVVAAGQTEGEGAALIAVDGGAPKPYRVGAELEGGLRLQSVQRRSVRLAPASGAGAGFELTLPADPNRNP